MVKVADGGGGCICGGLYHLQRRVLFFLDGASMGILGLMERKLAKVIWRW